MIAENLDGITTILVDLSGEVVDEDMPFGPLETIWQLDADLATRHMYPAIHPIYSTSSVMEGIDVDQRHFSLRQRAQKLLRRYRELRSIVGVHGIQKLPESELTTYERGERLEAYFTQSFYVAEQFTGPGVAVSIDRTLNDVEAILEGKQDHTKVEELKFVGSLS